MEQKNSIQKGARPASSGGVITHTPGPWEQQDNEISHETMCICTVTCGDDFVCISDDDEQTEAEARAKVDLECAANARLITAAPDMLTALEQAASILNGEYIKGSAREICAASIRAAIAKATGTTTTGQG